MNRERLFRELRGKLSVQELEKLQAAYWISKNTHRTQKRDGGERYFEHTRRVALNLIQRGHIDEVTLVLAFLHDAIEDTYIPPIVIESIFGADALEGVRVLSKVVPKINPATGTIVSREKKSNEDYYKVIAKSGEPVRLVKISDRLDNLRTFNIWKDARKVRYRRETEEFILPIAEKTDPWFAKQIKKLVRA